jgi:hypothetical protein
MEKKTYNIKFKIQNFADRNAMILALVNAGYAVSLEHIEKPYELSSGEYWVVVLYHGVEHGKD